MLYLNGAKVWINYVIVCVCIIFKSYVLNILSRYLCDVLWKEDRNRRLRKGSTLLNADVYPKKNIILPKFVKES